MTEIDTPMRNDEKTPTTRVKTGSRKHSAVTERELSLEPSRHDMDFIRQT